MWLLIYAGIKVKEAPAVDCAAIMPWLGNPPVTRDPLDKQTIMEEVWFSNIDDLNKLLTKQSDMWQFQEQN